MINMNPPRIRVLPKPKNTQRSVYSLWAGQGRWLAIGIEYKIMYGLEKGILVFDQYIPKQHSGERINSSSQQYIFYRYFL